MTEVYPAEASPVAPAMASLSKVLDAQRYPDSFHSTNYTPAIIKMADYNTKQSILALSTMDPELAEVRRWVLTSVPVPNHW